MISNDTDYTCVICMDYFIKPVQLRCGHIFCRSCIQLSRRNKDNCPLCRAPVIFSDGYRPHMPTVLSMQGRRIVPERSTPVADTCIENLITVLANSHTSIVGSDSLTTAEKRRILDVSKVFTRKFTYNLSYADSSKRCINIKLVFLEDYDAILAKVKCGYPDGFDKDNAFRLFTDGTLLGGDSIYDPYTYQIKRDMFYIKYSISLKHATRDKLWLSIRRIIANLSKHVNGIIYGEPLCVSVYKIYNSAQLDVISRTKPVYIPLVSVLKSTEFSEYNIEACLGSEELVLCCNATVFVNTFDKLISICHLLRRSTGGFYFNGLYPCIVHRIHMDPLSMISPKILKTKLIDYLITDIVRITSGRDFGAVDDYDSMSEEYEEEYSSDASSQAGEMEVVTLDSKE